MSTGTGIFGELSGGRDSRLSLESPVPEASAPFASPPLPPAIPHLTTYGLTPPLFPAMPAVRHAWRSISATSSVVGASVSPTVGGGSVPSAGPTAPPSVLLPPAMATPIDDGTLPFRRGSPQSSHISPRRSSSPEGSARVQSRSASPASGALQSRSPSPTAFTGLAFWADDRL